MSASQIRAKSQMNEFAWRYAFHAHLSCRKAPMTDAELADLAQAVHAVRGHLDPIAVADEVLLTWPFDVTEWGGLN